MLDHLLARARSRYQRTSSRLLCKRVFPMRNREPIISFTFDDFPQSGLYTGGSILRRFGASGTFYASFGLMGQDTPTGRIFVLEDLKEIVAGEHELGCHTFDHCDAWETSPDTFEQSITQNQRALRDFLPMFNFRSLSYPKSPPRPQIKRRAGTRFECCRGGGQRINTQRADRNSLAAFFLEQARGDRQAIKDIIDANRQCCGWLIFATHDVCNSPTPFGCTPEFFEHAVELSARSGAKILPVGQALEKVLA